jgi:hypothetical protein
MASSVSSVGASLVPQAGLTSLGQGVPARQDKAVAERGVIDTAPDTWRGAREAARSGLASLSVSAAAGREASALLDQIAAAAEAGRGDEVASLVERLRIGVQSAISGGANLLSGQALRIDGEGGGATVEGLDLRFVPPPEGALETAEGARAVGAAASQVARDARSFVSQWEGAYRRLSAHEGVLAAAAKFGEGLIAQDLDADGARLMALQVRQGLAEANGLAIANSDPSSILALFKS